MLLHTFKGIKTYQGIIINKKYTLCILNLYVIYNEIDLFIQNVSETSGVYLLHKISPAEVQSILSHGPCG